MRIAIVDPAAYSLPYDVALCEALSDEGHDVTLFTTKFAHGPMPTAKNFRIVEWFYRRKMWPLPRRISRGLQHIPNMQRLRRHLIRKKFDVVHVQWSVVDSFDVAFWKNVKLPTVFTAHNAVPREGKGESLDYEQLSAFDAVVVHSSFGEAGIRDHVELPNLWKIPHGALDTYRTVGNPPSPPLRLTDGPVVAMIGLLRPYKGVDVLLSAWPEVRAAVPNAQLVLAGRPMGIDLPQRFPEGVSTLLRFVQEEEFAWILRRADVVCLPYTAIDLSGVLFSALALGKPLVLSGVGGFQEFAGDGALLVEPGNKTQLAETLISILGDPAMQQTLSEQAQRAADELYSWKAIARAYTKQYNTL